ncbi:MAG: substrate-binding domain-containing protein [Chloroflexi bacterium]|nr:substrate-binding domain-containing protein [Chloroflexota bacterium]
MKRNLARRDFLKLSAGVTGLAALAACTSAPATIAVKETVAVKKEEATTAPVAAEASPTAAPVAGGQQVTILSWNDNYAPDQAGTPGAKQWDAMRQEFNRVHPEIKIEDQPITSGTEVRKNFIAANAAGNAPDFFYTYPPSMNPYYDQKFLLQMDELVNSWEFKDKVVDALWYDAVIDGHYYGIPADFYGMTLVWRKDLFAEAGLDAAPKDWNELVEFAKKLTKPDKKQYGFGLLGMAWASWYWENFVWQAGGEVTKRLEDGKIELSFTDEPGVEALQFYQDLKFKHQVTQENVLQDYGENQKDFVAGRTTMWMTANTSYSWYIEQGLSLEQLGTAPLPAGPKASAAQIGGGYWTLNPASSKEKQDAAWTYVTWRVHPDTWKFLWKTQNDLGITPTPWIPVYKGLLNQAEHQKVPAEWVKTSEETGAIARTEYVFKDKLEPYFAAPVQTVLTDAKANCSAVLIEAAKKMVSEIKDTVLAASVG